MIEPTINDAVTLGGAEALLASENVPTVRMIATITLPIIAIRMIPFFFRVLFIHTDTL